MERFLFDFLVCIPHILFGLRGASGEGHEHLPLGGEGSQIPPSGPLPAGQGGAGPGPIPTRVLECPFPRSGGPTQASLDLTLLVVHNP